MTKGPSQFPGVRDNALALMCQVGSTNESLLLNEVVKVLSRYDPFPLIVAVPAMIMLTKIGIVSVHQASHPALLLNLLIFHLGTNLKDL